MTLNTAIKILKYHQEWILRKQQEMKFEPGKITQAIDIVLAEVKKDVLTK